MTTNITKMRVFVLCSWKILGVLNVINQEREEWNKKERSERSNTCGWCDMYCCRNFWFHPI